ncbi:cytochrome P450 [Terricaulis silvestris]|uniref:Cytochrome P450-pinF1, plant-inducible n=1 Tax=Terricaulis silvestris TaxID=2686094 RepID=A0A6I6MMZ9_9CAUL|nr:cytochrome P450 [Terricaulis silvestris]QGZ96690.1 Cytochrome P450-pinF1, plant-inducible [Terricaulis silvestris]
MAVRPLSEAPEISFDAPGDAHAVLKRLREQAPLARTPIGIVLALRHRHLELVTSDATRQMETETKVMQGITSGPIWDLMTTGMLFANGDVHARRRAPVARTFAFKLMDAMRPKVIEVATELVEPRVGAGPIDFVNEIAAQLPARIIADILGVPRSDLPIFMQWIADTAESLGFIDLTRRQQIEDSLTAFNAYVGDLLEDRRKTPKGDFLSDYVDATARDVQLSEAEIRTQVLGLILAGSDTTRGSLCMTLAHLLRHPDQWRAFRADPDGLKKGVVAEGLRYEPIVSGVPRVALRDLDIDGYLVPAGTPVAVSLISALRDPEVYADPDTFDITRTDHPRWHPIFGGGAHRCVGEALARAEMEETLAVIARLAPNTALIGDFPTLAQGAIRQVSAMNVAFA